MELKIKQTGGYDEFFSKFQELANESGMGQDDLILLFSNALKPKCGLEVQIREPETIEEAYKIASKFEANFSKVKGNESIHRTNMVKREYRGKVNVNDKYRGKWTKSTIGKNFTGLNRDGYKHEKKIKCYDCNKFGHITKNCRKERKVKSVNLARIS